MSGRVLACERCGATRIKTEITPPVKNWERNDDPESFIVRHVFERSCGHCGHAWTETISQAAALSRVQSVIAGVVLAMTILAAMGNL